MHTPIQPATLAWSADGTPYSEQFGDVYHSSDGGLEQARQVFIAGNGLPERWRGRRRFTIIETGFGLGLNFLASWAAWRADPNACERLHFVSCELHPFKVEDLARLHARWPELAELAAELRSQWPPAVSGLHRLHLENGRLTLTLYLGDAREALAQLVAQADAFYLDGFSPAKNPELWSPRIFHLLARLAAPGATLATWSVAGAVREGLRHAGFEVEKAPGFGSKRQSLRGRLHPSAPNAALPEPVCRHALIIGAGLAGSSLAERLAARGWRIELIDAADAPGLGASGNHAGVLRPLPSLDDNRIGRLTRAGTLYGLRQLQRLAAQGLPVRFDACGVLHLARDAAQAAKMQAVVAAHRAPPEHLRFVEAAEASAIAGWPLEHGGWWFAGSGWVQPHSLCAAQVAAWPEHIHCHFSRALARLDFAAGSWIARDAEGSVIAAAPIVVLANGAQIRDLPQAAGLPVVPARGQVSHLPAEAGSAPRVVVCRQGYVSPAVDGLRCAGATFAANDPDPQLRPTDHVENLAKLEAMLPGYTAGLSPQALGGRVGFRPASPDRLPIVGALPIWPQTPATARLDAVERHPGLYAISGFGARGLVWSALAAELLASQLEQEALPIERDLAEALDPARFVLRPPYA